MFDLKQIVKKYEKYLVNVSFQITSDLKLSEDIIQETFIAFNQGAERLTDRSNILAYLYQIAKNKSIDALRQLKKKKNYCKEISEEQVMQADFTENSLLKMNLNTAIKKLEDKFREPVVLCDYYGLSYEEIGNHLNIPLNTVKSRVFRGREKLAVILKRMGVTHENV